MSPARVVQDPTYVRALSLMGRPSQRPLLLVSWRQDNSQPSLIIMYFYSRITVRYCDDNSANE